RHGERAPDAAQLPGQRKLAGELLALERLRRELAARGEDAERDGQVEARRVLRQLRRREVDRHAARRKLEAGMVERRPDAIARLAHLRVGQADDVKGGQAWSEVDLDGDLGRLHSGERPAEDGGDTHGVPFKERQAAPGVYSDCPGFAGGASLARAASSSPTRASSSASLACARSRSLRWTSRSSRVTSSSRSNHASSIARRFFSRSAAGELRIASPMRSFRSSKSRLSIMASPVRSEGTSFERTWARHAPE